MKAAITPFSKASRQEDGQKVKRANCDEGVEKELCEDKTFQQS